VIRVEIKNTLAQHQINSMVLVVAAEPDKKDNFLD